MECQRRPLAVAFDPNGIAVPGRGVERGAVEILHPEVLRIAHERGIEVRAIPVRIRDLVVRARRHQQLTAMLFGVLKRLTVDVKEEREAALKPASNLRTLPLPGSPFREGPQPVEAVAVGEILK